VKEPDYITVVATGPFIEGAKRCLKEDEREEFIGYIARNPTAGAVSLESAFFRVLKMRLRSRKEEAGGDAYIGWRSRDALT